MEHKKLRLVLFEDCNRNCSGCCNKDWDIQNLPVCTDYSPYEMILLTGGEPMLKPDVVVQAINEIREQTDSPIILYTANLEKPLWLFLITGLIDGLTVTVHNKADAVSFMDFDKRFKPSAQMMYRLRLNVFEEAGFVPSKPYWKVKGNMKWIPNCPLPDGEVLMRYKPKN